MKQLASKKTEHPTFKLILIDCYLTPRLVIFKLYRGVLYNKIIYHSSDAVLEYAAFASLCICLSRVYTAFDPLICLSRVYTAFAASIICLSRRYTVLTFFFICLSLCLSLSLAPSQKVILSLSLSTSKEDIQHLSLPVFFFHEGILRVSLLFLSLKKVYCTCLFFICFSRRYTALVSSLSASQENIMCLSLPLFVLH